MKSTTNKIKTGLVGVAAALAFLAPSLTFAQETTTYTVKSGDTLSGIAEKYNTTVEKLAEKNKIKDIHLIYVDQVLVIDGEAPATSTTSAATAEAPVAAPAATETTTYEAPAASVTVAEETVATTETSASTSTVSGSEAEAKEWIAQKESGGSYTATNGRYIGRYQLTDSYLNGDYSAAKVEGFPRLFYISFA